MLMPRIAKIFFGLARNGASLHRVMKQQQ